MDKGNEIWKDVVGYEGYYQVSNLGRVRSVDRIVRGSFGSIQHKKSVMLSPAINTAGYYSVGLTRDAKSKAHRVHRLVAEAFLPNPDNYPIINHKDENKLNNNVNNLEWCTYSYNTTYNNSMARRMATRNAQQTHGCEKNVYQYDINGNLVKIWKSLMEVSRELHVPWGNIANCCRGGKYRHTAYGYKWSYKPKIYYKMNRSEAANLLPILQAFAEGKQIQIIGLRGTWEDLPDSVLNFEAIKADEVRIKPEPKYRSFKDAEECWNEMLKHQPVGWMKDKSSDDYYVLLTYIDGNNIGLNGNNGWDFVEVMKGYTFADGSVFGIKEESEG